VPSTVEPFGDYHKGMVALIRVAKAVLLLILALVAISLIISIAQPGTGVMEKVALVGLITTCFGVGVAAQSVADRLQRRAARR
jgi:hypothetical protein